MRQFLGCDFRHLVEQDDVTELYLLNYKILYILLFKIILFQGVTATKLIFKPQGIHNSHYTIELRSTEHSGLGSELGYRADSLGYRCGFAYTARLDYNVIETVHSHNILYLLDEIHFESTAYATVRKSHKAVILAVNHSASLYEAGINVYLSYIIDYHSKLYAALI